jgi:hypothetical protein
MKRFFSITALGLTALGGLASAGVVGCYCDKCGCGGDGGGLGHRVFAGHGPVEMPAPNGSFVNKFEEIQANKAEPADFVFYPDEWYQGGTKLGPYGQYHLTQVIRRLSTVPFPVVIQPVTEVATNEARRQVIVQALQLAAVPDADPRVIIAYSDAEGLRGEEGVLSYYQMLFSRLYRNNLYNRGFGGGFGGLGYGSGFFGRNLLGGFGGGYGGFGAFGSGFGGFFGGL